MQIRVSLNDENVKKLQQALVHLYSVIMKEILDAQFLDRNLIMIQDPSNGEVNNFEKLISKDRHFDLGAIVFKIYELVNIRASADEGMRLVEDTGESAWVEIEEKDYNALPKTLQFDALTTQFFKNPHNQRNLKIILQNILKLLSCNISDDKINYHVLEEDDCRVNLASVSMLSLLRDICDTLFSSTNGQPTIFQIVKPGEASEIAEDTCSFEINTDELYDWIPTPAVSSEFDADPFGDEANIDHTAVLLQTTLSAVEQTASSRNLIRAIVDLNGLIKSQEDDEASPATNQLVAECAPLFNDILLVIMQPYSTPCIEKLNAFKIMVENKLLFLVNNKEKVPSEITVKVATLCNEITNYMLSLQRLALHRTHKVVARLDGMIEQAAATMQRMDQEQVQRQNDFVALQAQHHELQSEIHDKGAEEARQGEALSAVRDELQQEKAHTRELERQVTSLSATITTPEPSPAPTLEPASTPASAPLTEVPKVPTSTPIVVAPPAVVLPDITWSRTPAINFVITDANLLQEAGFAPVQNTQRARSVYRYYNDLVIKTASDGTQFQPTNPTSYQLTGYKRFFNNRVIARAQKRQAYEELRQAHQAEKLSLYRLAVITDTDKKGSLYTSIFGGVTSKTKKYFAAVFDHIQRVTPADYHSTFLLWKKVTERMKANDTSGEYKFAAIFLKVVLLAMGHEENLYLSVSSNGKIKIDNTDVLSQELQPEVAYANELLRAIDESQDFTVFQSKRPNTESWLKRVDFNTLKATIHNNKQAASAQNTTALRVTAMSM